MGRVAAPDRADVGGGRSTATTGKSFSMPPRRVLPKPYTDPHPPIWVAAGSPGTFEKAARLGIGVLCFTLGTPDTLAPADRDLQEEHREGRAGRRLRQQQHHGHRRHDVPRGRRPGPAPLRRQPQPATTPASCSGISTRSPGHDGHPGMARPAARPDAWPSSRPASNAAASCVGDPDEIARTIQRFIDVGADQLTFSSTVCDYDMATSA